MDCLLKVRLNKNITSNYVFLPNNIISTEKIGESNVIAVEVKPINSYNKYFLGCIPGSESFNSEYIELSDILGNLLNLKNGDYVKVNLIKSKIEEINWLQVEPLFKEDYELIEHNSEYFEEEFLNQLIIVYSPMKCFVRMSDDRIAELLINLEQSNKPFKLGQNCELEVKSTKKSRYFNKNINNEPLIENSSNAKIKLISLIEEYNISPIVDMISHNYNDFSFNSKNPFEGSLVVSNKFALTEQLSEEKEYFTNININLKKLENSKKYNRNSEDNQDYELIGEDDEIIDNKVFQDDYYPTNNNSHLYTKRQYHRLNSQPAQLKILLKFLKNNDKSMTNSNIKEINKINESAEDLFSYPFLNNFWLKLKIIINNELESNQSYLQIDETNITLNTCLKNKELINLDSFILDSNNESSFRGIFKNKEYHDFLINNLQCKWTYVNHEDNSNSFPKFIFKSQTQIINLNFLYYFEYQKRKIIFKFFFKSQIVIDEYMNLLSHIGINSISNINKFGLFTILEKSIYEKILYPIDHTLLNEYNLTYIDKINSQIIKDDNKYLIKYNSSFYSKFIGSEQFKLLFSNESKLITENIINFSFNFYIYLISYCNFYNYYLLNKQLFTYFQNIFKEDPISIIVSLDIFKFYNDEGVQLIREYLSSLKYFILLNKQSCFYISFFKTHSIELISEDLFRKHQSKVIISEIFNFIRDISTKDYKKLFISFFYLNTEPEWENEFINTLNKNSSDLLTYCFKSSINYIDRNTVKTIVKDYFENDERLNDLDVNLFNNFVLEDINKIFEEINKEEKSYDSLISVLNSYVPLNISNEQIKSEIDFRLDIAGYLNDKKDIYDTINIYFNAKTIMNNMEIPIKLCSGMMLYGPSGCGKTIIAQSIAKELKVNFISVKGPELLNKYIGASEENIRKIFDKAKNSSPCIIFFDEFDSLAPTRGSGSTGVTDRMVNQLLTYLDGVEGREGIFVLAATGRPHLLDPAVIRPGRVEKHILIDLPKDDDRVELLNLYLNKANLKKGEILKEDVVIHCIKTNDIRNISKQIEGFNCSDIQSLIYNSFLLMVKDKIMKKDDSKGDIILEHIETAIKEFNKIEIREDIEINRKFKHKNYVDQKDIGNKQTYA